MFWTSFAFLPLHPLFLSHTDATTRADIQRDEQTERNARVVHTHTCARTQTRPHMHAHAHVDAHAGAHGRNRRQPNATEERDAWLKSRYPPFPCRCRCPYDDSSRARSSITQALPGAANDETPTKQEQEEQEQQQLQPLATAGGGTATPPAGCAEGAPTTPAGSEFAASSPRARGAV